LSVAEAALRLGISKDALRRRIDRKSIKATKVADGTWRVHLATDPPTPDATTTHTPDDKPRDTTPTTALLIEKDARIALLTDQLTTKDRQIHELHVMLQAVQRQLPATVPEATAPQRKPPVRSWLARLFGGE
jgi:excisionase family DNA binding protein